MKKTILILALVLMTGLFTVVNAASAITEKADVKVSVNGTVGSYTDPPIVVDGRTLLPLRALLTNLGVTNDNEHIIWNGAEQSVTVIKDSTKIYLAVGTTNAKINDAAATIDVAPINYKSRVYIPARFVAEAFGMNVAWDAGTKSVLITSQTEIKTADGKFSAMLPAGWVKEAVEDADANTDLSAEKQTGDTFFIASMVSKLDYTSFGNYKDGLLKAASTAYEKFTLGDPSNVTVGGNPAVQYVVSITSDDVNMKMLLTYVEGPNYYGAIACVCPVSYYSNMEPEMLQITNSIKGL